MIKVKKGFLHSNQISLHVKDIGEALSEEMIQAAHRKMSLLDSDYEKVNVMVVGLTLTSLRILMTASTLGGTDVNQLIDNFALSLKESIRLTKEKNS